MHQSQVKTGDITKIKTTGKHVSVYIFLGRGKRMPDVPGKDRLLSLGSEKLHCGVDDCEELLWTFGRR